MIRTLRIFFLSRLLREKLLLLGFVGIGVAMWASAFSKHVGTFWRAQQVTSGELAFQRQVLAGGHVVPGVQHGGESRQG